MNKIIEVVSCLDGYDPKALRVDKAREAIRACLTPIAGVERVATRSALGRVLAEEVVPRFDVPAHDNSAMDGYAVRDADIAEGICEFDVTGKSFAGEPYLAGLSRGTAVRVFTGALVPPGTNRVTIDPSAQIPRLVFTSLLSSAASPGQAYDLLRPTPSRTVVARKPTDGSRT